MAIKLFKPFISETARKNVQRILESDQIAEGEEVKLFEQEFARFGFRNVLAVNSGTSALELAYDLAGLTMGSEVITPVLTCTATNIPLVRRGCKIIFADTDHDLNVSIDDIKRKITPNTKAIIFVHFGGNNRGLKELVEICKDKNIILIEDSAQAVGSAYWGHADYTAVSLQAIKTLTSGDGGILICKSDEDHKKAKRLRWFGYDREEKQKTGDTDLLEAGYKYHMNNVSAAIGRGNLAEIQGVLTHRRLIGGIYSENDMFVHSWLSGGFTDDYVGLKATAEKAGFEIGQHHYRNDKYSIFKKFKNDCPIMDKIEGTYYFVPYHHGVTGVDALNICNTIKNHS